jgi:catechol 2,3-dioxygenase-like lactoylglutathione lyase family enzyme
VTIQQLSWQIQTLEEMVSAVDWFKKLEVPQANIGRGMPGSNWHTYPSDPDGHRNEIFYGMEQVGWQGVPKPQDMYYRRFRECPELPQVSEAAEVRDAIDRRIDLLSGYRDTTDLEATYEVDGILLPRPFKITHVGPVGLFVDNMEGAIAFYVDAMGFIPTETVRWENATCHFLRCSTEHHSVALYPLSLRERLGLTPTTTCAGLGIRVANFRQLRAAVQFLRDRGYRVETDLVPPALTPGMDYTAFVFDPDGNPLVLHCYMEQVGWDGKPRAASERRPPERWPWPEAVEPVADVYMGEPFFGPLG